jgi:NitT/TauT family transport system substrate-binding protein
MSEAPPRLSRRQLLTIGGATAAGGLLAACAAPAPVAPTAAPVPPTTPPAPAPTAPPKTALAPTAPAAPAAKPGAAAPAGAVATRTKVTVAVNFFAQSAQGGFWAALKDGEYARLNLDASVPQGSPQISPVTMVASGQHDFNQQTMDTILISRQQGIPLVALLATFSDTPLGVMYHAESPLKDFGDLKGRIAYLGITSNWYKYIVKKFNLEGAADFRNYTGQIGPFLADKSACTQCFISSEPIVAKKQGFDVGYLRVADSGYNPYTNVLFTSDKYIAEHSDVVQAVVTAALRGWNSFIDKPSDYLPYLKEQNPEYDIALAAESQKVEATLYTGKTLDKTKFGLLSMERVKTLHDQLREVGVLERTSTSARHSHRSSSRKHARSSDDVIYDVRTYDLTPFSVTEFERRFGEALLERQKITPLGAFWHTEIGPLNRVVHVWPYDSLEHMREVRKAAHASGKWPADLVEFMQDQHAEIMLPTRFSPELRPAQLGPLYEMHISTVVDRMVPTIVERWEQVVERRAQLSPLVACWYSELGLLNKFVHVWAYRDFAHRDRIAAEASALDGWPPLMDDVVRYEESQVLLPAAFSPLC